MLSFIKSWIDDLDLASVNTASVVQLLSFEGRDQMSSLRKALSNPATLCTEQCLYSVYIQNCSVKCKLQLTPIYNSATLKRQRHADFHHF